jgi:ferric-dicitrate binding protein FerR (iron transport regulator)
MDELNEKETLFVREWIEANEQNRKYFEELQQTWHLLGLGPGIDTINTDQEWNYFKRGISTTHLKVVSSSGKLQEVTHLQKGGTKKRFGRRMIMAMAVAASVLAILFARNQIFFNTGSSAPPVLSDGKKVYATAKIRTEVNFTSKPKKILLTDGSEILLYENSELSFDERFPENRRDIRLSGKADFTVTKDKERPFTVHSGEVSTTALGTKFTVTSYKEESSIKVRLYEGKVVVKSSTESLKKMSKDYILIPGNELQYYKSTANAKLRLFKIDGLSNGKKKRNQAAIEDRPSFPTDVSGNWFMFNNQSLDQVFDQLALMFDRKIIYSKKEIHKIYFIGKFDRSDDLKSILEQIATLNRLTVTSKNESFIITK